MRIQRTMVACRLTTDHLVVHVVPRHLRSEVEVKRMFEEIDEVVDSHKVGLVVVNCSRLVAATSSFFGKLMHLNEKCKQDKRELRICSIPEVLREGFKVLKLHKVLSLYDTEEKALK